MTETMATGTKGSVTTQRCVARLGLTSSIPWDIDAPGTCGQIQPCNELKLVDVKEMGVGADWSLALDEMLMCSTAAKTSRTPVASACADADRNVQHRR